MPPWATVVVNQLLARFILTIYGQKPYYSVLPLNRDSVEPAKIASDILFHQVDRPTIFDQVNRFVQSFVALGFGTLKTGWDFTVNDFELTNYKIKHFFYAPYCQNLTKLPWGIFRLWRFLGDMQKENEAFKKKHKIELYTNLDDIPKGGATLDDDDQNLYTAAEKEDLIELFEYWDDGTKRLIANRTRCILEAENPVGFVPGICCSDTIKLDGIQGTGEIEMVEDYIEQIATIVNQRNDNILLSMNPVWLRNSNIIIHNEKDLGNLKAGMRINVDVPPGVDLRTVLYPFEVPFVTGASYTEVSQIEKWIEEATGMHEPVRGMRGEGRETATGIARLQTAGSMFFRYKILFALRTAFTLLVSQQNAWNQKYLPDKYIYAVTGSKEGIEEYRESNRKDIQGDFKFREVISALDPEGSMEFKRSQLMEAVRVIVQGYQMMQMLPPEEKEEMRQLIRLALGTFNMPELEEVISGKRTPTNPQEFFRRMMTQRGASAGGGAATPGGGPMPGARAATPAGRTTGRQEGGMIGKAMGQLGGR